MNSHPSDGSHGHSGVERIDWIDIAKAIAVFLVVVYHVSIFGANNLLPGAEDSAHSLWELVSTSLLPVRMPLFFLASGLLAARAIQRPWRSLGRSRFGNILWPYLIWSLAFSVVYGFAVARDAPWDAVWTSLIAVFLGGNAYWYLTALVLFFTVARVLRNQGPAVVMATLCVWMLSPWISGSLEPILPAALETNMARWLTFAIWFMLGCFARSTILSIAELRQSLILPLALAAYAVFALLQYVLDANRRGLYLGMNIVGIVSMISISVLLARSPRIVTLGRYIASRTLPIYLVHAFVLYAVVGIVRTFLPAQHMPESTIWISAVFVPVVSITLTVLSTWIYDFTRGTWLGILFQPPGQDTSTKEPQLQRS